MSVNSLKMTWIKPKHVAVIGVLKNRRLCLLVTDKFNLSFFFTFVWPRIVTNFFVIKPTRRINFINLFWHETLYVSNNSSVHHQEFIHCTISNGISHTAFEQDQVLLESSLQTCMTYTIAECTVNKLLMMDRGIVRNMYSLMRKINLWN